MLSFERLFIIYDENRVGIQTE